MNGNKKISRVIYNGNDNKKYIKLNKEFILLSKLSPKQSIINDKKIEKEVIIKYKSTGNKTSFMNDNKKISRVIHIGTDNEKYIKLDKEFILLSKFI